MKFLQLLVCAMIVAMNSLVMQAHDFKDNKGYEDLLKLIGFESFLDTVEKQVYSMLIKKGVYETIHQIEKSSRPEKTQEEICDTQIGIALFKGSIGISLACASGGTFSVVCAVAYAGWAVRSKMNEKQQFQQQSDSIK